jgi:hypothetical protein
MIVNCRRLRNILSFLPYLSVNCICASLPKIVDRIRHEGGEAPRAGLPKIIYTTDLPVPKIKTNKLTETSAVDKILVDVHQPDTPEPETKTNPKTTPVKKNWFFG